MSKIETLLAAVERAKKDAEAELKRMCPVGTQISFYIQHGQRNPSTGTVWSAGYLPGYLRVKHHEAKPNSRYAFRDVHWTSVIGRLS